MGGSQLLGESGASLFLWEGFGAKRSDENTKYIYIWLDGSEHQCGVCGPPVVNSPGGREAEGGMGKYQSWRVYFPSLSLSLSL